VVLLNSEAPWTEPGRQGGDEAPALQGMIADELPFLIRELPRLVEDVGVHGQLADVVQERRPAQPVPVGLGEAQLVGDHVGEGSHPFGVPARHPVVAAQRGGQSQDVFGHTHRHRPLAAQPLCFRGTLEVSCKPRPPRHLHPLGGAVGKEHRHLQQRGQGQEPSAHSFEDDEADRRGGQRGAPPKCLPGQTSSVRDGTTNRYGHQDGYGEGSRHRCARHDGPEDAMRPPPVGWDHIG
jgi:hypothetical protein